jgi:hypothetical protein
MFACNVLVATKMRSHAKKNKNVGSFLEKKYMRGTHTCVPINQITLDNEYIEDDMLVENDEVQFDDYDTCFDDASFTDFDDQPLDTSVDDRLDGFMIDDLDDEYGYEYDTYSSL